jgi:hypothetical protein
VADLGPAKAGWVEGWSTTGGSLLWQVNIRQAGKYELSMIAGGGKSGVIEVQTAGGAEAGWSSISETGPVRSSFRSQRLQRRDGTSPVRRNKRGNEPR